MLFINRQIIHKIYWYIIFDSRISTASTTPGASIYLARKEVTTHARNQFSTTEQKKFFHKCLLAYHLCRILSISVLQF